jgi:hypothetical protein
MFFLIMRSQEVAVHDAEKHDGIGSIPDHCETSKFVRTYAGASTLTQTLMISFRIRGIAFHLEIFTVAYML